MVNLLWKFLTFSKFGPKSDKYKGHYVKTEMHFCLSIEQLTACLEQLTACLCIEPDKCSPDCSVPRTEEVRTAQARGLFP
jgi:hypothetical protein